MANNTYLKEKIVRYQQLKEDNRHDAKLIWGTASILFPLALLAFIYAIQVPKHQLLIARGSITLVVFWFILTLITHILIIRRKSIIEKFELDLFGNLENNLKKKPSELWWVTNILMVTSGLIITGVIIIAWIIYLIQNPYNPHDFVSSFKDKKVMISFAQPVETILSNSNKIILVSLIGEVTNEKNQGIIVEPHSAYDGANFYSEISFHNGEWFIPYDKINFIREIK